VTATPAPVAPAPPKAPPTGRADHGVNLPSPREVDRIDPFGLVEDEIRLLDLVGPPHLIATPRQAKRLANSYGLLTALREPFHNDDLKSRSGYLSTDTDNNQKADYFPYRASVVLLASLVARPAEGSELVQQLRAAATKKPHGSWTDFLSSQAGDSLATLLLEITRMAARHDLELPEPLEAWAEWIIPVGRLSFPAGSVR
jgi:hypothetical protein